MLKNKNDLEFNDFKAKLKKTIGKTDMITVFDRNAGGDTVDQGTIFCALIDKKLIDIAMSNYSWDVTIGYGMPGIAISSKEGKKYTDYYTYSSEGIEPLVIVRHFDNSMEGYIEIAEDFRLCFNLYEQQKDKSITVFLHTQDDGEEIEVARIENDVVKIKLRFLKEYLAVRKMALLIYFDLMRFTDKKPNLLKNSTEIEVEIDVDISDVNARVVVRDMKHSKKNFQGWILGKKIIHGLKDFKLDMFWPSKINTTFEEFIVGINEDGIELLYTCDEKKINNNFGKNKNSPNYLQPIFFKKEVLKKYYDNHNKYTVEDGMIFCDSLWSLRIDNNHSKYVVVMLGDLGKLSHNEQLHWKSYNIYYNGGFSHVAWQRGFQAEFAEPEAPDLFFKYRFERFQDDWFKKYGWHLFKPLTSSDIHHLKSLHSLVNNTDKEFDEQIGSLVKIMIDSINEKKIGNIINLKQVQGSINKFEEFIKKKGYNFPEMIIFLRNLQTLRSTSIAHRKSSNNKKYKKVNDYFNINKKTKTEVFDNILIEMIKVLNTIDANFIEKRNIEEN